MPLSKRVIRKQADFSRLLVQVAERVKSRARRRPDKFAALDDVLELMVEAGGDPAKVGAAELAFIFGDAWRDTGVVTCSLRSASPQRFERSELVPVYRLVEVLHAG